MEEVGDGVAVKRGRVVRFNADKGYGFIAPAESEDDEDVFFHVSTLSGVYPRDIRPGMTMEYDAVDSDGGFKAVLVKLVAGGDGAGGDAEVPVTSPGPRADLPVASAGEPGSRRRASKVDLERVVTDILIGSAPAVTGREIASVREQLVDYAHSMGWIEG
jgi:cold shock CspA family protein